MVKEGGPFSWFTSPFPWGKPWGYSGKLGNTLGNVTTPRNPINKPAQWFLQSQLCQTSNRSHLLFELHRPQVGRFYLVSLVAE